MVWLRKFLGGFFGWLALIFAVAAAGTISTVIRQIHEDGWIPSHADKPSSWQFTTLLLSMLPRLILVLPLPFAALFATTWWKITRKKVNARSWAIASSLATLLQALPSGAAEYYFWTRGFSGAPILVLVLGPCFLALGIAGLVAFVPRDALSRPGEIANKPHRIAGDGTSGVLDIVALLTAVGGYWWGHHAWMQWGSSQDLPFVTGYLYLPLLLAAVLADVLIHECGHAIVGRTLGMRLRAFIVGPLQWHIKKGRWRFRFLPAKMFSGGGATALVPTSPQQSRWDVIFMIAAGPFASLCTGMAMFAATFFVMGTRYEPSWEFLSLVSTFGFISFFVNLIPVRPEALYSDGARIYQLLAGGPLADYFRVVGQVSSISVTPLRPRDYDIEALQRAARSFTEGSQGMGLRLFASDYFQDCGRIPEAHRALLEAEEIYDRTTPKISDNWMKAFVFGYAFLGHDVVSARRWWERLMATKPMEFDSFYWRAKSALHWIEGDRGEAKEAWENGFVLSQESPETGSSEFGRDRFAEQRRAIDGPVEDLSYEINEPVPEPVVS